MSGVNFLCQRLEVSQCCLRQLLDASRVAEKDFRRPPVVELVLAGVLQALQDALVVIGQVLDLELLVERRVVKRDVVTKGKKVLDVRVLLVEDGAYKNDSLAVDLVRIDGRFDPSAPLGTRVEQHRDRHLTAEKSDERWHVG